MCQMVIQDRVIVSMFGRKNSRRPYLCSGLNCLIYVGAIQE
jgi:hypothetical protein